MKPEALGAAAMAGLATGPRSFTGLAAVVLATPADASAQPDKALAHPAAKTAIGLLALQEWVMDKLPKTPSRLETLGLVTRATGAGAAGAIIARRAQVNAARPSGPDLTGVEPAYAVASLPTEAPDPDWKAMALGAVTGAGVALGVAVVGVRLRGAFAKLFGHDWPGAGLEDASSAALAAGAVYLSTKV